MTSLDVEGDYKVLSEGDTPRPDRRASASRSLRVAVIWFASLTVVVSPFLALMNFFSSAGSDGHFPWKVLPYCYATIGIGVGAGILGIAAGIDVKPGQCVLWWTITQWVLFQANFALYAIIIYQFGTFYMPILWLTAMLALQCATSVALTRLNGFDELPSMGWCGRTNRD